jgi:drug/metabolite transporter (DMT)-like permease
MKALLFACIAAVGNAIFVFGQKKSVPSGNPFIFLASSLSLCVVFLIIAGAFFPAPSPKAFLSSNWKAGAVAAFGLFITYLGFYLLYTRFGATYYTLYAVISIVTTSILVGVFILKESFSIYYVFSIICAVLTIVFFFAGHQNAK